MPIDTSMYGRIRGVQLEDPNKIRAEMAQLKAMQNQNKLFDMKVADSERAQASQNRLMQITRDAFDPTTNKLDPNKYRAGLGQAGDYQGLQKFETDQAALSKEQRAAEKAQLESQLKKFELAGQIIGGVKDQATWEIARQQTAQVFGPEAAAQMPAQYDPALIEQKRMQAMGVKEQLEQKWKALDFNLNTQKFDETKRNNQVQNSIARSNLGVAQENLGLRREEVGLKRQEVGAGGKAPPGYRFTPDGNLQAIPGGPADIKAGELGAKRERQQAGAVAQADRIINKVDQALGKVGWTTSGFVGSVAKNVPGSTAKDLQGDLETIKANLGFAELQAMREASPTGGALGAIAVQELIALQSTVASLDQAQSPAQLEARLGEIGTHYNNWKKAVQGSKTQSANPSAKPSLNDIFK